MVKVELRGAEYECEELGDMEVFLLLSVFGSAQPEEGTKAYIEWFDTFVGRMGDPNIHQRVAYFLRSTFPDIPDRLVRYDCYRLTDGREKVETRLKITADELLDIVKCLEPLLEKAQKRLKEKTAALKGSTAIVPAGIAPTEKVELRDTKQERKELLARLAQLDSD